MAPGPRRRPIRLPVLWTSSGSACERRSCVDRRRRNAAIAVVGRSAEYTSGPSESGPAGGPTSGGGVCDRATRACRVSSGPDRGPTSGGGAGIGARRQPRAWSFARWPSWRTTMTTPAPLGADRGVSFVTWSGWRTKAAGGPQPRRGPAPRPPRPGPRSRSPGRPGRTPRRRAVGGRSDGRPWPSGRRSGPTTGRRSPLTRTPGGCRR